MGKQMTYKGVKIPKCNGRPQLWLRGWSDEGNPTIRIIYPSGYVEYETRYAFDGEMRRGCTSRRTQLAALRACIKYDFDAPNKPEFLGYL